MKRSVVCIIKQPNEYDENFETIGMFDSDCDSKMRPLSVKTCKIDINKCGNESYETNYWIADEWSKVSLTKKF